jgi:hypothetical protein
VQEPDEASEALVRVVVDAAPGRAHPISLRLFLRLCGLAALHNPRRLRALNSVVLSPSRPSAEAGARTARNSLVGFEHGPQRPTKAHGMDRVQGDAV